MLNECLISHPPAPNQRTTKSLLGWMAGEDDKGDVIHTVWEHPSPLTQQHSSRWLQHIFHEISVLAAKSWYKTSPVVHCGFPFPDPKFNPNNILKTFFTNLRNGFNTTVFHFLLPFENRLFQPWFSPLTFVGWKRGRSWGRFHSGGWGCCTTRGMTVDPLKENS